MRPASCTFELVVTPPAAYRAPSTLIPASGTLMLPAGFGTFLAQPQATAPTVTQSTTYTCSCGRLGDAALDPQPHPAGSRRWRGAGIEKLVDLHEAEIGDSVRYTLRIRNVQGGILPGLFIDDRLPLGFRYIPGTARRRLNGGAVSAQPDPTGGVGPRLTFAYP